MKRIPEIPATDMPERPDLRPVGTGVAGKAAPLRHLAPPRTTPVRPAISVIINCYNYGAFLGRAIDSVLAQTRAAAEIVVVDDGSTDNTPEVMARYDRAIVPVVQKNGGQASAINAGVRHSRGDLLCFLDADDWWSPGKLEAIADAFAACPEAGLVYHRLLPTRSDGEIASKPIPRTLVSGDISARMLRSAGVWPFPMTSAISVRRTAWDAAGEIPAEFRISADAWLVGVIPLLMPVEALPEVLGHYRIHDNTWHRAVDDAAMLRRRMKHWELTVRLTNAELAARGREAALDLRDHFPHRLAGARLDGAGFYERLRVFLAGLRFGGEPHPLRRCRDALRALRPFPPAHDPAPEPAAAGAAKR